MLGKGRREGKGKTQILIVGKEKLLWLIFYCYIKMANIVEKVLKIKEFLTLGSVCMCDEAGGGGGKQNFRLGEFRLNFNKMNVMEWNLVKFRNDYLFAIT